MSEHSAVREVIVFRLRLGPETEAFKQCFAQVRAAMREIGVEPGRVWHNMHGTGRDVRVEREFPSLAAYELDDENFHAGPEFMALWREMESHVESMTVELYQAGGQ